MLDEISFNRGMLRLGQAYPDYDPAPTTVNLYYDFLKEVSPLDFEKAVNLHISTYKWFPKVSELLDAVRSLRPSARDAWSRLMAAAESGELPEMDRATAAGLTAVGGWDHIQFTEYSKLSFSFKVFEEAFQRIQDLEATAPGIEHKPQDLLEER